MQSGKERTVLECEFYKRIHLLLERQVHSDTNGPGSAGSFDTFIRSLHQTWAAAGDDVASHFRQCFRNTLCFFVGESSGLCTGRAENRHAIAVAYRRLEAGQVVNDVPQAEYRFDQDLLYGFLVSETHGAAFLRCRLCFAHSCSVGWISTSMIIRSAA